MKVKITGKESVHIEDAGQFPIYESIELIAENKDEQGLLSFIKELNERGGFVSLLDAMTVLINSGVLQSYNGKWVWDEDWEAIAPDDPAYH